MRIFVGACVVLLPSVAAAVPVAPPPAPPERAIAVTISPLHLLSPVVEVTGEYRLQPKLGVAVTPGAGSVTAKDTASQEHRFTVGELGASARYYVTGSFRQGVQVGGEVMYLYVKLDDTTQGVQATGDGVRLTTIRAGSYYHTLGLRSGDLVTAIDGAPLRTLDDAAGAYARLGAAKKLTIAIDRAGVRGTLRFALK